MEETDVFRIVYYYDDSGIRWYRWYNFKKEDWERLGYNDSSVHTDIISTAPRTVVAHMSDGTENVIYKNGMFQV